MVRRLPITPAIRLTDVAVAQMPLTSRSPSGERSRSACALPVDEQAHHAPPSLDPVNSKTREMSACAAGSASFEIHR